MIEIGLKARKLPAPPSVVWESLVEPRRQGARLWLNLLPDEVEPRVLEAEKPNRVVWSSLWPSRPNDQVHFELTAVGGETSLKFTLLTPDEAPDQNKTGHLRRRLNHLLFADLRFSYGQ
ncbi:SRPBCC domain-containing protein [Actinoallomurus purpureus]|uniref:SRPBCC family protein n=1 Tax=Actinoallomurus purpureus TaxID=478114 RepID=UPI002093C391|nr:SRPBCC domain-containing protein [Actinoallomurus purpureus]MCO6006867.1 SRPBCC domain-containing protein [Actinoallomurus purpureus]